MYVRLPAFGFVVLSILVSLIPSPSLRSMAVLKLLADCGVTTVESAHLVKQANKPAYKVVKIFILKEW